MKNKEIEESINRIKKIVDFYKLNDENNYDYSDDVLISMKNLLSYIEQLENNKEKEYVIVGRMQLKTRDYIHQLEKEKRQLENNRDKAIKFIKEKRKVFEWYDTDLFYLESLLKGDSE